MSEGNMVYFSCMMPRYFRNDVRDEAKRLNISEIKVLEIKYYGYPIKEEVAEEAKEALEKQIIHEISELESEKLKIIENWWRRRTKKLGTEIVNSCEDILKEALEN